MTNQKERPRAENKGLNNGVAMLDFEDFGYGKEGRTVEEKNRVTDMPTNNQHKTILPGL